MEFMPLGQITKGFACGGVICKPRQHYSSFGNIINHLETVLMTHQCFEQSSKACDLRNCIPLQQMMLKDGCAVSERWTLTFFELCASRLDDSNGATESFWELNGVELWRFNDKIIFNAKTFLITCWGYI